MAEEGRENLPRINFRVALVCALSMALGCFFYFRIRFSALRPADFCFLLTFLLLFSQPPKAKRLLFFALFAAVFAGLGVGLSHAYTARYLSGPQEGEYFVSGTVTEFTVRNGYTDAVLSGLSFDGAPADGKMRLSLSGEVRAGDIVSFTTHVTRNGLPMSESGYDVYLFYSDIRYGSPSCDGEVVGTSGDPFLRLNAALYGCLTDGMDRDAASVAYALLTGHSHAMDSGLADAARHGGIAHIFAVSGLHIGILFGAVYLAAKPFLRRKAYFPAIAAALLYTALCAFSVSSLCALIACAILGGCRAVGRKYDFLQSIGIAAVTVLAIFPADWLSPGFRLSFGACLGLALFSGSIARAFKKIRIPRVLSEYLSACLAVQLFTAPILLETFGYISVWGFLLNFLLIPLLPVFFLGILLFTLSALLFPFAASGLLLAPRGLLAIFLFLFRIHDFSFVLTGFSLDMGWLVLLLVITERVRLSGNRRAVFSALAAAVFVLLTVMENVTFFGAKVYVYRALRGSAVLFETPEANVLVIDGNIRAADCEDFLAHRFGGQLDAVFVLSDEEMDGINHAAFLPSDAVYAADAIPTGLHGNVVFARSVSIGEMTFTYESREKLSVSVMGTFIEVDFTDPAALGADLFLDGSQGGAVFFIKDGGIGTL